MSIACAASTKVTRTADAGSRRRPILSSTITFSAGFYIHSVSLSAVPSEGVTAVTMTLARELCLIDPSESASGSPVPNRGRNIGTLR